MTDSHAAPSENQSQVWQRRPLTGRANDSEEGGGAAAEHLKRRISFRRAWISSSKRCSASASLTFARASSCKRTRRRRLWFWRRRDETREEGVARSALLQALKVLYVFEFLDERSLGFLGCEESEVLFVQGASISLSLLLETLDFFQSSLPLLDRRNGSQGRLAPT